MTSLWHGAARRLSRALQGAESSGAAESQQPQGPPQGPDAAGAPDRPWAWPHHAQATAWDIFYCFRLLLGRSPVAHEWPGHSARVGESLDAVVASYVNSREFARRGLLQYDLASDLAYAEIEGVRLLASRNDLAVGKAVHAGSYEPHVAAIFKEVLAPGMAAVDVGANIGFFAMLAARLVGPEGFVQAVEPNPDNVRLIEASRRANGFEHLAVLQAAAGRSQGLLALYRDQTNAMARDLPEDAAALLSSTMVSCLPLDAVLPAGRRIDLIKADVEGAEHNVFLGAEATIARWKPFLVWEFTPFGLGEICGVSWREHLDYVRDLGYRISVIRQDGTRQPCDCPDAVFAAFEAGGVDHLDLFAQPA